MEIKTDYEIIDVIWRKHSCDNRKCAYRAKIQKFKFSFTGIEFSASDQAFRFHEFSTFLHTLGLMLIGGILAFCMEVAEFMVVTYASSLTLAIVGVFKVNLHSFDSFSRFFPDFVTYICPIFFGPWSILVFQWFCVDFASLQFR